VPGSLRWKLAGGIAVLAIAAWAATRLLVGPSTEVVRVERRDLVHSIVASGRVAAPYRVDIGAQVVGTVSEVPVAEGQFVKAGQALVVLEASEARAGVRQAEVAVEQAEARLRQLRELQLPVANQALRQAEANLENARAQYERNKRLQEGGFLGRSALDESQRNLAVQQAAAESARRQMETARPAGSDHALAQKALEQARASLETARARLAYTTLSAPVDGTLIARDVERGDVVQPGKALMVLSPAGETQVLLRIDERNLGLLRLGQAALVSAEAYPADRFAAELVYVNPGVDAQRGTVDVKLRVQSPPPYLRQDMTVSVDIEIQRRSAAIAVRSEAVHDLGGASPWVLVVAGGRAERRPVSLGLRGEGWVEILAGAAEGELVVPASNLRVKAGQSLRPVPRA
jgi:HlyD family secretion protein